MKKTKKIIGFIAAAAIIGFIFAACNESSNSEKHTHSYNTAWTRTATQHWHECSCGDKKEFGDHQGTHPCSICGYDTKIHVYSETYSNNATQHWFECGCGDKKSAGNHRGNPCSVCSFHTHSYTMKNNTAQHWMECSGCGDKKDTDDHAGNHPCAACGYDTGVHSYSDTFTGDSIQHWNVCGCGDKTNIVNHAGNPCILCGHFSFIEMVQIPGGNMPLAEEDDQRNWGDAIIKLSPFKMGIYEVTQEQYLDVMGDNPSNFSSNPADGEEQDKRPVERVGWYDAVEFCNRLSIREGLEPVYTIRVVEEYNGKISYAVVTAKWTNNGYRLPTEAQWEYACRAGSTYDWYFGYDEDLLVDHAWYVANAGGKTHQVGLKDPNPWGLYDMYGNVHEWCWDVSFLVLKNINQTDPKGSETGSNYRILRGGAYNRNTWNTGTRAPDTRSWVRFQDYPFTTYNSYGFRVVLP